MGGGKNLATSLTFEGRLVNTSNNPFTGAFEYGIGVVLVGHECLMFGGFNGGGKHRVYKFDIAKKKWSQFLPENRVDDFGSIAMTFVVDDRLYAYVWCRRIMQYMFVSLDLVLTEAWVRVGQNSCPQVGHGPSGAFVEATGEGVLFGGEKKNTDVFVYNVERSSWYPPKVSGTPPGPRKHHCTCCAGRRLFIVGGQLLPLDEAHSNELSLHVLTIQGSRFAWSTPATIGRVPKKRYLFSATYFAGRIFVYGGNWGYRRFDIFSIRQSRWFNGVSSFADEEQGEVQFTSELEGGNAVHAAVVVNDKIFVFGGTKLVSKSPLEIAPT